MFWDAPEYLKKLDLNANDLVTHVFLDLACRKVNPLEYLKYYTTDFTRLIAIRISVSTYTYYGIPTFPDYNRFTLEDIYQDLFRYPGTYVEGFEINNARHRCYWVNYLFSHTYMNKFPENFEFDSYNGQYPNDLDTLALYLKKTFRVKELPIPRSDWTGDLWVTAFSLKEDPPKTLLQSVPTLPDYDFVKVFDDSNGYYWDVFNTFRYE